MDKVEVGEPVTRPPRTSGVGSSSQREDAKAAMKGTKAISRATLILRLIARHEIQGTRLTQLATLTGIPHPTVRRVLKFLIDERLVSQDPETRRYRLGPLNFELGLATLQKPSFVAQFNAMISRIAAASGDTTYLMVRGGADAVCLDRVICPTSTNAVTLEVGGRRPLGFGAAGLALLAQYPDHEVQAILEANRREIEVHRRITVERIMRRLAFAHEHGYALTRDVATIGFVAVGMVVPTKETPSPLAISVSSPKERMTEAHIQFVCKLMQREIKAINRLLLWPHDGQDELSDDSEALAFTDAD